MVEVRTRFSPSPTGSLHLGGAHTALFNWLIARHFHGAFILRIEDTDKERSKTEFVDEILDAMHWLGLEWDEGPYYQTERLGLYREYIDRLLAKGAAYYCDCSPEDLQVRREAALARGDKPKYDGRCRSRNLGPGPNTVVRFQRSRHRRHSLGRPDQGPHRLRQPGTGRPGAAKKRRHSHLQLRGGGG